MAFVAFVAGETDADSPLNQVFFDKMRLNFDDLVARFSTSSGHDHDGTDSKLVISVVNADVASANALPVLNPGQANVTGITTILTIDALDVGSEISLRFDGILTLIDDGDNLRLPNGGNITTVAGTVLNFTEVVSGKWLCTSINSVVNAMLVTGAISASGSPAAGALSILEFGRGYFFFPMIHTSNSDVYLTGHDTDGADPDETRIGFINTSGGSRTWDLDARFIRA